LKYGKCSISQRASNGKKLLQPCISQYKHAYYFSVTVFAKGQSEIGRYRFLAQGGGYVWVLTQATLLHGGKAQQPISVVCVNFVIR
jgi:hypothetical protein